MLDAILVTDNPYTNNEAISIGIAIKENQLIEKNGDYWSKYNTTSYIDKDLVIRNTAQIRSIGTSYAGYYNACTEATPAFSFISPNNCKYTASYSASNQDKTNMYGAKQFNFGKVRSFSYSATQSAAQYASCGEYNHIAFMYVKPSLVSSAPYMTSIPYSSQVGTLYGANGDRQRSATYSTVSMSGSFSSQYFTTIGAEWIESCTLADGTFTLNITFAF